MPIRLSPMIANPRVFPLAAIQFVIRRAFVACADAEQRAEGVERVEPPVKAKRELIEVSLQMLRADAVVASGQPAFGNYILDSLGCEP